MTNPELLKIYGEAVFVFGTPKAALLWLSTPVEALGNRAPRDLVETASGVAKVRARLKELEQDYRN